MAARKPGTAARPGTGGQSRDKGTRGGRPEAIPAAGGRQAARPPRTGNGQGRQAQARTAPGKTAVRPRRGAPARTGAPPRTGAPARTGAEEAAPPGVPAWLRWATLVLSLGGLGVSIYLTIAHFNTSVTLACPATSTINCEKVTTSPESYVFGIPVAVLGLAFYVFMVAATSPWAWRSAWPPLRWARVGSVVAGILFVLYLIYTELFTIGAICLWCTSVHVITFFLFGLIVFAASGGYGVTRASPRS